MTLCVAWIRETDDDSELVFATDSTLTGGEKWNHGVKLFELPRKDCMLCFAGETQRAYPLLLNLTAIIKHDDRLQNPHVDIEQVLYGIVDTFSELVNSIFERPRGGAAADIGTEAKFLFGGWSWRENRFRIWRLSYAADAEAFIPTEETHIGRSRVCVFLGDPNDESKNIAAIAAQRYKEELMRLDKFDSRLDMEPLAVLIDMSRDRTLYEVDGALQIGKVYRSGNSEFFGIMWPSVNGLPHFLGKNYDRYNKPRASYYDPDTCELVEDLLPRSLVNLDEFSGSDDYEFLQECYSREANFLKEVVTDREHVRLIAIFKEHSYQTFRQSAEVNLELQGHTPDADDES